MRTFLQDLLSVGSSKFIIIIFGLLTSIVTARLLGPEGNGIIAGLTVYPSLFMSIGSLGIRQSTTYYIGKNIFSEDNIKSAITQIWFFTSIFSVFSCYFLIQYLNSYNEFLILTVLALIPIPFSLFNTYNSGLFLGKNDIKTFNKINWIPHLIIFISTIIFVIIIKLEVRGAMIAQFSGPLIMFFLLLFKNKFLKYFSLKFDLNLIFNLLKLGSIYALSLLVINLNYKIDIILLGKLSSAFELGIYTKGAGIIQYLWQIPMFLSTIVFARSAVSKNDLEFSLKVSQLLRITIVLIGSGSLMLFLLSDFIIIGMYGDNFIGSISVLNLLVPGVLLMTFFKVMNMDLAGKGKPWISLKAMVPSLIINIILNVLLIPIKGSDGAALASTISYSLSGLLFLHFYSKEVRIPIKKILAFAKSDFDVFLNFSKK
ncbi:oligosaccharide flippase family protein [Cecembia lonarensis]|uniref:MATE efflux family protein n=1 Tax=Cecembia lonarensis (strain CCUG 58316 / KCTC 22772 / LW9) TaxID=1225176 RepID=K1LDB0_CECL9|nr:polysaccharide biosynthesis C-terminal domain-containing protein [Cecembia lonarensis]EKB48328.1 MATE efflux family protein [Cecembia lonarensis LW9]